MGRFLISGYPRCRSAWLAALMTAHGAPCLHEPMIAYGRPVPLSEVFSDGYAGISDPGATIIYRDTLKAELGGSPAVLIRRDSIDSHLAFARWLGHPVPHWDKIEESISWFESEFRPLVVDYADLDKSDVVGSVVKFATGLTMDERIFRLFDTLKIEQHRDKALARMKGSPWL